MRENSNLGQSSLKMTNKKVLILGLGNEILSDDGIGPRIVRELSEKYQRSNIRYEIVCCGGLDIVELIRDYEKVILVDAIKTSGGIPGDVYFFKPSEFKETLHLSGLHDINFITALRLSENLDQKLPVDLHIIAIEIIEDMEFSEELTMPLKEAYPSILENVSSSIKKILAE